MVRALDLRPHPEGGHYRETWRDAPADGGRGALTAILFLLAAGECSHWHRVDATELWLWHAGAALRLALSADGLHATACVLGPCVAPVAAPRARAAPNGAAGLPASPGVPAAAAAAAAAGPQVVVPAGCWQSAASLGAWTLVSCVVAPAFHFSGFELAPPRWQPGAVGGTSPDRSS